MYTEYKVRQLLEEAFEEGYDNGIDDTQTILMKTMNQKMNLI